MFVYFFLGTAWAKTKTLLQSWPLLAFIVGSPIGIGIGAAIESEANDQVNSIIQAIAGGTILHVAIHEMIAPSLYHKSLTIRLLKIVVLTAGYMCMSLIGFWA